jgi:predicted DNA-binding protein
MKPDINPIDELQEAYTAEILLNGEMAERIKELEKKYEATIGYLKEALEKIANDRSPPWDKTDFERIARETLNGLKK